jgi:uncharacterized damage-inducible protein DinB
MPTEDKALRTQLTALLKGGQAHADIRSALADFPVELAGAKPHGLPYSAWQLLEHIRFTLHDLLVFSTDSEYEEPNWPDDYWPKQAAPPNADAWKKSVRGLEADIEALAALTADEHSNLYDTIPWGKNNETLLREVLLAADHTSYHTGELIVLRRLLGAWK